MSTRAPALVIVGSGLAAWTLAREVRKRDADRPITLITRDSGDVYSKPMLSNALASGKSAGQLVSATSAAMAAQHDLQVLTYTEVHAIDRSAKRLHTDAGPLPYGQLVLALGADPLRLPLQGDAAGQVLSVNDLADYARFRERLARARHVTVIGAGLIGCEFANDLVASGHAVSVVDPGSQPLGRLLPPQAGAHVAQALAVAGVDFHFGQTVNALHHKALALQAELSNGTLLDTDLVLSAVGLRPRTGLAQAAGLPVARGIVVNRQLQTSDPDIFALGDCAEVQGLVLPFVLPLMQAARTLAPVLTGQHALLSYPAMPVVVKTPAVPVVVAPPAPEAVGQWQVQADELGVDARFVNAHHQVLGFALVGSACTHKSALQKALPPVLA